MLKYLAKTGSRKGIKFLNVSQFNFASKNLKEIPGKKMTFIESLKEKFSFLSSKEEKIDTSTLTKRNEEADVESFTKLESEKEELNNRIDQSLGDLDIDKIESLEINDTSMDGQDLPTYELLLKKYNLKLFEQNSSIRKKYNSLSFKEVITPRLEELAKMGFSDFQIKTIIQKSYNII
jgi:hypothetical protein